MGNRIVISESQYNRLFLREQTIKNNIIILPADNAGQIQEFLKSKGVYKGKVDWDFGDKSAEAFGKYYRKFGPIRTLKELYTELKSMGYPVGNDFGFGPKMAKVISDLIKEKESKPGDKVIQTSEKCTRSCKEMTDEEYEETLSWIFSDGGQKALNSKVDGSDIKKWQPQKYINKKITYNNCMKCHSVYGAYGLKDRMAVGDLSHLPSFYEMQSNPELRKKHKNIYDAYEQAHIVGTPNHLDAWLYEYRHEIIDVLAIAALFIPIPGVNVALSMLLEGINGGMYLTEGDELSGYLSFGFMFIPGVGPLYRRLTQKSITKVMKIVKYADNLGKKSTTEAYEYLVKKTNKLTPDELELLEKTLKAMDKTKKTYGNITKSQFRKEVKQNAPEWIANYKKVNLGFGKGSRFLDELMNPTMLEKFIFAGTILSGIYLDKSGKMENFGQYVMEKLVELGWVDADAPVEEKQAIVENYDNLFDKYKNKSYGVKTDEELKDLKIEFYQELDTNVNFDKIVHDYDLPAKVELINSELEQKKIILNKLKNVPEGKLRDFDNYKWAQLCKGKNKITSNVIITPEIEEFLNDEMFNIRRIKSSDLGSNYEYASDEDGLWYFKKTGEDSWKLVTDCMALLKIETAMEKDLDSDIDTEGEVFDIYRNDVDIEYKDF